MRTIHKILIGGVGTALVAGAAIAASHEHVMTVKLSDNEVAKIAYVGDTAPRVQIVQREPQGIAFADDLLAPFVEMDRLAATMDAHFADMMRQGAIMQQERPAISADGAPQMVTFTNLPRNASVHYSYSSTTVGADGCVQTVSWSSDGSRGAQPKMVKTSSASCSADAKRSTVEPVAATGNAADAAPSHRI